MRIIIYILFLFAVPLVSFGQKSQATTHLVKDECISLFDKGHSYGSDGMFHSIILNSQTDNFIYKNGTPSKSLGNIDRNYREQGDGSVVDPSTDNSLFENVTFNSAANSGTQEFTHGTVACGGGIPVAGTNKPIEQSAQSILIDTTCEMRRGIAYNLTHGGKYEEGYKAYQDYFEHCAIEPEARFQFNGIGSANAYRNNNLTRFAEYREWLKKVLYYNTTDLYYCADVGELLTTFYWFDDIRGKDYNGSNTVLKYLIESGKCTKDSGDLAWLIETYEENRQLQLQKWRDTVKDSLKTPIDTTLPSLEDLDLTILRGPNQGAVSAIHEPRLDELIATRNPFTDVLELKYRLSKSGMVRIDVYDLLGRAVYGEGQGYKQDGKYMLSLQAKSWSPGSYYVRLSTPSGEVKTVKVMKE